MSDLVTIELQNMTLGSSEEGDVNNGISYQTLNAEMRMKRNPEDDVPEDDEEEILDYKSLINKSAEFGGQWVEKNIGENPDSTEGAEIKLKTYPSEDSPVKHKMSNHEFRTNVGRLMVGQITPVFAHINFIFCKTAKRGEKKTGTAEIFDRVASRIARSKTAYIIYKMMNDHVLETCFKTGGLGLCQMDQQLLMHNAPIQLLRSNPAEACKRSDPHEECNVRLVPVIELSNRGLYPGTTEVEYRVSLSCITTSVLSLKHVLSDSKQKDVYGNNYELLIGKRVMNTAYMTTFVIKQIHFNLNGSYKITVDMDDDISLEMPLAVYWEQRFGVTTDPPDLETSPILECIPLSWAANQEDVDFSTLPSVYLFPDTCFEIGSPLLPAECQKYERKVDEAFMYFYSRVIGCLKNLVQEAFNTPEAKEQLELCGLEVLVEMED